jgi:hypothetical protein
MNESNASKTPQSLQYLRLDDPNLQRAANRLHTGGDLKLVLTKLNEEYIQALRNSHPDESGLREELYQKIASFDDLLRWVETYGKTR